jgi:hypothetical protein
MNLSTNEKELFYVFIPNIIYGFLFEIFERNIDQTNFTKESYYFKNLYVCKLISLIGFILVSKVFKDYFPKYSIVITAYLFNILLILSDNSNITEYEEAKKEHINTTYYKSLQIRTYFNYVFFVIWLLIIIAKIKKWMNKLKSCEIEVKEEVHEHAN